MTTKSLHVLIDAAREVVMTDREAQRRSFVFGNTHLDNDRINRELLDQTAEALARRTRG